MPSQDNPSESNKAAFWETSSEQGHDAHRGEPALAPIADPKTSPHGQEGRGPSIAAIWLAVATLLLAVPWPVLSPIPAAIGVALAAVGFRRSNRKSGLAIAGLIASILAMVLGIGLAILYILTITQ